MNGGYKITGIEELEKAIERMYSGSKAKRIKKEALNAGGDLIVENLKKNFESFQDTGYSKDDIVRTQARSRGDTEELSIGWSGEHGRWRLVHLNEFGYTRRGKQYTPKGFGAIDKTRKESKEGFIQTVAGKLRAGL